MTQFPFLHIPIPGSYVAKKQMQDITRSKLEKVEIIATDCHLRPHDAIAFPSQHLLGVRIWTADKPNAVLFAVAVGHHVNAAWRVCDRLGQNKIVRVSKNSGSILRHLRTNVYEILGQCRRPFVLPNALTQLSISRSIGTIFAIKSRSRRKPNKCKMFSPPFFSEGMTPIFPGQIVSDCLPSTVWHIVSFTSICWSPSEKPGHAGERKIHVGLKKTHV